MPILIFSPFANFGNQSIFLQEAYNSNKTEKSFSPIVYAIIDKYLRIVQTNVPKVVPKIVLNCLQNYMDKPAGYIEATLGRKQLSSKL